MRICIYGAGATGGHLAVKLGRAGHAVSVVATPTLDAVAAIAMRLAADRRLFDRNAWPEASLW